MSCLLHVCCANCLSDVVKYIQAEHEEVVLYWANPNIHPLVEWRKRRKSVRLLASRLGLKLVEEPYGLYKFISKVGDACTKSKGRCSICYGMRFGLTAKKAAALELDCFTSTLLVSKMQDNDAIMQAGQEAAEVYGVTFYSPSIQDKFKCDEARPRDLKLYKQNYCGCVFSEEERFIDSDRGN